MGPGSGVPAGRVRCVPQRPYTLLSCAVSVDGCLDDASARRLILSGREDLDEVDELRTATGDLDPAARFFAGPGTPLVYCASSAVPAASGKIGSSGTVIDAGDPLSLRAVLSDLHSERSVATVLVEGGAHVLRDALADDLADELRLAVAPFFVGDPAAPRFALSARYPHTSVEPMTLVSARRLADTAVLHYRLSTHPRPADLPAYNP